MIMEKSLGHGIKMNEGSISASKTCLGEMNEKVLTEQHQSLGHEGISDPTRDCERWDNEVEISLSAFKRSSIFFSCCNLRLSRKSMRL